MPPRESKTEQLLARVLDCPPTELRAVLGGLKQANRSYPKLAAHLRERFGVNVSVTWLWRYLNPDGSARGSKGAT
jgi:hypothetical protein